MNQINKTNQTNQLNEIFVRRGGGFDGTNESD
jgi:hypothetical protein